MTRRTQRLVRHHAPQTTQVADRYYAAHLPRPSPLAPLTAWGFRSSAWEAEGEWTHACILETDQHLGVTGARSSLRIAAIGGSAPSTCVTCQKLIVGLDDQPFRCMRTESITRASGETETVCTSYYREVGAPACGCS